MCSALDEPNYVDPTVIIENVSTEYVRAVQPSAVILSDKANVLFLQIRLTHRLFTALGILGFDSLEGPHDDHQQIVPIWRDRIGIKPHPEGFNTHE